jgi:hypothetical protein
MEIFRYERSIVVPGSISFGSRQLHPEEVKNI